MIVLGIGAVAAYWDLRWRRIPNKLSLSVLATGLIYHAVGGGWLSALAALGAGFLFGTLLFQLGAIGGGDVKWLAALGALLGWHLWLWSVAFGLMAAGVGALAQLARRGRLIFLLQDLAAIVREWRVRGLHPDPERTVNAPAAVTAPLAPALALGLVCALLRW